MKTQTTNSNHPDKQEPCLTITRAVVRAEGTQHITKAPTGENAATPSSDDEFNPDEYNALLSLFRRGTGGFTVAEAATVVQWTGRVGLNAPNHASKAATHTSQNATRTRGQLLPAPATHYNRSAEP